jgi:hypothetical protein
MGSFGETSLNQPRISPEQTYEFFGHTSWPKEASRKGERVALPAPSVYERTCASAGCLRPTCPDKVGEAEFARSSGRGLRRVKKFIQAAKGICKKTGRLVTAMEKRLLTVLLWFSSAPRSQRYADMTNLFLLLLLYSVARVRLRPAPNVYECSRECRVYARAGMMVVCRCFIRSCKAQRCSRDAWVVGRSKHLGELLFQSLPQPRTSYREDPHLLLC